MNDVLNIVYHFTIIGVMTTNYHVESSKVKIEFIMNIDIMNCKTNFKTYFILNGLYMVLLRTLRG